MLDARVTIGGKPALIVYAGAAPFQTSGLLQINVVVPLEIDAGDQAVVLTFGTATSQDGLTVAVK